MSSSTEGSIGLIEGGFLESAGSIPEDASVEKSSPNELTTKEITYSGTKKVTFTKATIDGINENDSKGSGAGSYVISGKTQ